MSVLAIISLGTQGQHCFDIVILHISETEAGVVLLMK